MLLMFLYTVRLSNLDSIINEKLQTLLLQLTLKYMYFKYYK